MASNSSDETSYCSMLDDDCDSEMNKWFENFFYHVDQAVFYDKKLKGNYEKIEKECQVWNNLFKLKNVDLNDPEIKKTIFTAEKLGKRPQLVEEMLNETGKFQLMKKKEKSILFDDEELKLLSKQNFKPALAKKVTGNKAINQYFELNDEFDKITFLNQVKQDYIRKHVLNSATKSDGNTTPHHSLIFNPLMPFPIATNSNLNRRKQIMMEQQNKLNEDAASSCLYFCSNKKRDKVNNKLANSKEEKTKIRTVHSIIKIEDDNKSNLIVNLDQIIQPKNSLILPPIFKETDLPQKIDKFTIHDKKKAILKYDKSLKQCSVNLFNQSRELRSSAFRRPIISIKDEIFK